MPGGRPVRSARRSASSPTVADGAGSIGVPGAQIGDTVGTLIGVVGTSGSQAASFEGVITVADQLQAVATSDLSVKFYRAYLVPATSIV